MKLRILFFGATADAAGMRSTDLEFAEGELVGSFIERLVQQFPPLEHHKLRVALNEEYADMNAVPKDGDELAIFTAVSGG